MKNIEKVREIPILNIKMMSDEKWKELCQTQKIIKNGEKKNETNQKN